MRTDTAATTSDIRGRLASIGAGVQGLQSFFKLEAITRAVGMIGGVLNRLESAGARPGATAEMQRAATIASDIRQDVMASADGFFARMAIGLRNIYDHARGGLGLEVRAAGYERSMEEFRRHHENFLREYQNIQRTGVNIATFGRFQDTLRAAREQVQLAGMSADEQERARWAAQRLRSEYIGQLEVLQRQRRAIEENRAAMEAFRGLAQDARPQIDVIRNQVRELLGSGLNTAQISRQLGRMFQQFQIQQAPLAPNAERRGLEAASIIAHANRDRLDPIAALQAHLEGIEQADRELVGVGRQILDAVRQGRLNPIPPPPAPPPAPVLSAPPPPLTVDDLAGLMGGANVHRDDLRMALESFGVDVRSAIDAVNAIHAPPRPAPLPRGISVTDIVGPLGPNPLAIELPAAPTPIVNVAPPAITVSPPPAPTPPPAFTVSPPPAPTPPPSVTVSPVVNVAPAPVIVEAPVPPTVSINVPPAPNPAAALRTEFAALLAELRIQTDQLRDVNSNLDFEDVLA